MDTTAFMFGFRDRTGRSIRTDGTGDIWTKIWAWRIGKGGRFGNGWLQLRMVVWPGLFCVGQLRLEQGRAGHVMGFPGESIYITRKGNTMSEVGGWCLL